MMHLFEALLALHDATQSNEIYKDAEDLANSIYSKLFQEKGGYLPEVYDENWKPLPVSESGRIHLGHQFEWAFLLSQAFDRGFPQRYMTIGERLLEYGMKVGYDRETGGIYNNSDYDGKREERSKGWWQQDEHLRALMNYAALRGRPDLWEPFEQSLAFWKQNFMDAEYGGSYSSYSPDKPREGSDFNKGRTGQVGYHVCSSYLEAVRLTGGF